LKKLFEKNTRGAAFGLQTELKYQFPFFDCTVQKLFCQGENKGLSLQYNYVTPFTRLSLPLQMQHHKVVIEDQCFLENTRMGGARKHSMGIHILRRNSLQ
jgi:hypothetical protein